MKPLSASSLKSSIFLKLFFTAFLIFASTELYAARTINSATFPDYAIHTGNEFKISVTVTTDTTGPGSSTDNSRYRSLEYKIGSGSWQCATPNNVLHSTVNTFTDDFNLIAPLTEGVYDISLRAYSGSGCTNTGTTIPSDIVTFPSKITVTAGYPLDFSHGIWNSAKQTNFDCDALYMAEDAVWKINSLIEGSAASYTNGIDMSEIYRAYSNTPLSKGNTMYGAVFRTMAIGPYGEQNGTITAFHWWWDRWDLPTNGVYNDDTTHRNYHGRPAFTLNGTSTMAYMSPVPPQEYGWSGGEVNQMTGEIYFSGREDREFNNNYKFMIYNPKTNSYTDSGRVQSATPSDNFLDNKFISSDMAIDAEGNFYVLVQDSGRYFWIVKVVPGTTGNWKYSRVLRVGDFRNGNNGTGSMGTMTDLWGMAFFNGKLYASFYEGGQAPLHEIDPLTGKTSFKGNFQRKPDGTSSNVLYDVKDLASCQVAIVARGKVYFDENGNGKLESGETKGMPDILVQIYDSTGKYLGEQNTNGVGEYSFMLPKVDTTFYIRIKQPQNNGANIHQTWASGGGFDWHGMHGKKGNNTVEPQCYNTLTTKDNEVTRPEDNPYPGQGFYYYGRPCYGANINGTDGSLNEINTANFYSKVSINTDRAVTIADFALGPVDIGDAPASYGNASHAMSDLKIGSEIDANAVPVPSTDALGDDNDATPDDEDGVWIIIPTEDGLSTEELRLDSPRFKNATNVQLFTRIPYKFKVKVEGDGYLNAWTNIRSSGNAGAFLEPMNPVPDMQDGGAGDEDGVVNGEILFTYFIPKSPLVPITDIYFRFRYASVGGQHISGINPPKGDNWWNSHPWITNGEVEDYMAKYDPQAVPFYCNTLYATAPDGTINRFVNPATGTSFLDPDFLLDAPVFNGSVGSIAMGRYRDKITLFSWSYDSNKTIKYLQSKASVVDVTSLISPSPSGLNSGVMNYWSGGVIHPSNGMMYLSGYLNTTLHASPFTSILQYVAGSGISTPSGNLSARTPADQVNGKVASDVFLGADGSIYTLAEDGANYHLIQINPIDWKYSRAAVINGDLGASESIYGLAFLDGKIYASTLSKKLYEIDPSSGDSREIDTIGRDAYYDLATCQVAPIVTGTLYFDKNADGALDGTEKASATRLSNVTVELYDQNGVFLADRVTNDKGEYNFMINRATQNATFYVRVKQPVLLGQHAVQTWAGGGTSSTVMRVCDGANITGDGACYGVNGALASDGGDRNLSNANYYSILILQDAATPSNVDFGFSGVDRSDAPLRYGNGTEVYHSAIKHILTMGNGIDADTESLAGENADNDAYDDGVQIKKTDSGTYQSLQGFKLEADTNYTIRVYVNGNMSDKGYLRAWISLHDIHGALPTWLIPIHNSSNISGSYQEFEYSVPMSMFGEEEIYFRFRFALEDRRAFYSNNASTASWAHNIGEVEDYRVIVDNNNPRKLEEIFNEDVYGDVRIIGNTIIAKTDSTLNATCPANDASNDNNNISNTRRWNVNNAAYSSSSAYLEIPSTAKIKAAFLRWQGANIKSVWDFNRSKTVTLTTPSGGSHAITADLMNWYNHAYQGTANITSLVVGSGSGNYSVSDIFTSLDKNSYGAWSVIVVYDNQGDNNEVLRKAIIYDGFSPITGSSTDSIHITGFKTSNAGDVDSKMFVFAGEGDAGGGDSINVNGVTVGGSDPMHSTITYFGTDVLNRDPACTNTLGADIHTYDVGTNGSRAIGNDVEEVNTVFSTATDTYYVGLAGFSIQLYEPRVCYYIDKIVNINDGTTIFENGTFDANIFNEEQEYDFTLFIANIQDETNSTQRDVANNVQAHMTYLKPTELNYTLESTKINNMAGTYVQQTDDVDSDLAEYDNTTHKHNWRLGHGADGSKGGSFDVAYDLGTSEKSIIDLKMYLGKLDANAAVNGVNLEEYLKFEASYNSETSNVTRTKDIAQCRDMNLWASLDPHIGSFNVVNENFNAREISTNPDDEDNALYTQVAGQEFGIAIVALEETPYNNKLKLVNYHTGRTLISLDLIDGRSYDYANEANKSKECEEAEPAGISSIQNAPFYQINDPISNELNITRIMVDTNVTIEYGKFRVKAQNNITGDIRYFCSLDRFSIRPAGFVIALPNADKLIGGAENNATLQAVNIDNSTVYGYNQTANTVSFNATLDVPASCVGIDTNINSTNFWVSHNDFTGYEANETTIRYDNVGDVNLTIVDGNWTHVDQVKYGYTPKDDCIHNSSVNAHDSYGKVGCIISSNQTDTKFIPYKFNANVTVQNANTIGNFTYLSNNGSMSAVVTTDITAILGDAAGYIAATNYHQNCFAKNVTYEINLKNDNLTDWNSRAGDNATVRIRFFEKDAVAELNNNNSAGNGVGGFKIGQGNFSQGTVDDVEFGFNFYRNTSVSENPFILSAAGDLNITDDGIQDEDTKSTNATINDSNITFFYGRAFIDDQQGPSDIIAPVQYELFCRKTSGCNMTTYGIELTDMDTKDSMWYINTRHNGANSGDILSYDPRGLSNTTSPISAANGVGYITIGIDGAVRTPYTDTIIATPNKWMVYNKDNDAADNISFKVTFIGDPGDWAGKGQVQIDTPSSNRTGVVIDAKPDNKTKSKVSW